MRILRQDSTTLLLGESLRLYRVIGITVVAVSFAIPIVALPDHADSTQRLTTSIVAFLTLLFGLYWLLLLPESRWLFDRAAATATRWRTRPIWAQSAATHWPLAEIVAVRLEAIDDGDGRPNQAVLLELRGGARVRLTQARTTRRAESEAIADALRRILA